MLEEPNTLVDCIDPDWLNVILEELSSCVFPVSVPDPPNVIVVEPDSTPAPAMTPVWPNVMLEDAEMVPEPVRTFGPTVKVIAAAVEMRAPAPDGAPVWPNVSATVPESRR